MPNLPQCITIVCAILIVVINMATLAQCIRHKLRMRKFRIK